MVDLGAGTQERARRPRVSIVIPAYNAEQYVGQTIDSVRAQTFGDWELVVYDDGSTDGTRDVAQRAASADARIRVVEGENGGVAAARNRGYTATDPDAEFVIFLDNDDVWEPDALASMVAVLDANPEYPSAHSLARCIDGDGVQPPFDDLEESLRNRTGITGRKVVHREPHQPTRFADLAYSNCVLTPGLHLIRRSVFERVGGFDPAAVPCDDWDMAVRVSRFGDVGYVDRPLLHWRRYAEAQSYQSSGWSRGYHLVRSKMIRESSNTPAQARLARQGFRYSIRWTVVDAFGRLRRREPAGAARQLAKAVYGAWLYGRTSVRVRLRRVG